MPYPDPLINQDPTVIFPDELNPVIDIIQNGWTAQLANVIRPSDGATVQKIVDWFGGYGTKPAINIYLGLNGFVADIEQASALATIPTSSNDTFIIL